MMMTLSPNPNPESSGEYEKFYGVVDSQTTLHAPVIANINGVQVQIMLDSGAGSSHIHSDLLTKLNRKPCRTERGGIEQTYGTFYKHLEIYTLKTFGENILLLLRIDNDLLVSEMK